MTMDHLSIKGLMSGMTFCGLDRSEVLAKGEEVIHPVARLLERHGYREKMCSECLAVWDNPERPTNPVPGLPLHRAAVGNN